MTRELIAVGRKHDEAMTEGWPADNRRDSAVWFMILLNHPENAAGIAWMRTNLRALLDGYAAALDELGHATAHDGDHLSKASRAMVETVMNDRDRLRADVLRLTETARAASENWMEACRQRDEARADAERLKSRQQDHLALIAKITRETPYPAELEECRSARRALIAEVGTLRATLAESKTPTNANCDQLRDEVVNLKYELSFVKENAERLRRDRDSAERLPNAIYKGIP